MDPELHGAVVDDGPFSRDRRASIAQIAEAVEVGIILAGVRTFGTVVQAIADAVTVAVVRARAGAAVAGIANAVGVGVPLARIGD